MPSNEELRERIDELERQIEGLAGRDVGQTHFTIEMWRFELTEDFGDTTALHGAAKLLRPTDDSDTGELITVYDPDNIFENHKSGQKGTCFRLPSGQWHALQGPC